jgi:hypothetical protein
LSHLMTALAMRQSGLKPAAKIVLYWLADHHNESTGDCFPSLSRLAELSDLSRRAVIDHLADLEARGLIKKQERRRENGSLSSNSYTLTLHVGGEKSARGVVQNLHGGSAESALGVVQNLHPHNLVNINPVREPITDTDVSVCDMGFLAFNELAEKVGWPKVQQQSPARQKALSQRISDCGGIDNWRSALDRAASSPLLTGQNTRGWRADFDWLCKPANFTKLMEGNYDKRNRNANNLPQGRADGPNSAAARIADIFGLGETQGHAGDGVGGYGGNVR